MYAYVVMYVCMSVCMYVLPTHTTRPTTAVRTSLPQPAGSVCLFLFSICMYICTHVYKSIHASIYSIHINCCLSFSAVFCRVLRSVQSQDSFARELFPTKSHIFVEHLEHSFQKKSLIHVGLFSKRILYIRWAVFKKRHMHPPGFARLSQCRRRLLSFLPFPCMCDTTHSYMRHDSFMYVT